MARFCTQCGAAKPTEMRFCGECGQESSTPTATPTDSAPTSTTETVSHDLTMRRPFKVALGVVAVLIVMTLAASALGMTSNNVFDSPGEKHCKSFAKDESVGPETFKLAYDVCMEMYGPGGMMSPENQDEIRRIQRLQKELDTAEGRR